VALAEEKACTLDALSLADMQNIEASITEHVFSVLSVENSVASRLAFGGTAPDGVRERVADWQNWLKENG
jgi:argininosuccinate lyase